MAHVRASGRRWMLPSVNSFEHVTEAVAAPMMDRPAGRNYWIAFAVMSLLTLAGALGIAFSLAYGPGLWGNNSAVVWGFPIANYVWWIGIGNAGTLISSLLLLTRQKWRASINRAAEAMTLFAVSMAGIFPILHLGRQLYFYWLFPYPATMGLWPQWRSALVWDFWSILSYLLFSILFFYVGLIPDLATLRDRPGKRGWRRFYGVLAMGWQGTPRQWRAQDRLHTIMAVIAVPLVCSVHSIVGLDFAASLMPGWTESIFPPYFVVGAFFSGFAVVVLILLVVRWALTLEGLIVPAHFDVMAKVILASAIVMGASYMAEWFSAWWGGDPAAIRLVVYEFTGDYWWLYLAMLAMNVLAPQLFWAPRLRTNVWALIGVSIAVLVGMWLERILIILNTLSTGYEPSFWRTYAPTLVDFIILFGTLAAFVLLFLILARIIPVVSMHEVRELLSEERRSGDAVEARP
jgi:molybdopterin-containing oxidoreductase family membrane subunit